LLDHQSRPEQLREHNDPSWGCSARIARYPAKIPHFFENLQILTFYAMLLITPFVLCKSFIGAP
jgi:hypothetical protein